MGLDDLLRADVLSDGLDPVTGLLDGTTNSVDGLVRDVEDLLPDELNKPLDDVHRTLDRLIGPDPFDMAEPVLLDHDDPILHVANRAAYGPTPSLVHEIRTAGGPEGWLSLQLRPQRIDDSAAERRLRRFRHLERSAQELREDPLLDASMLARELRAATVLRQVWSRRQLLEVMTQFWGEHFSVSADHGDVIWHKPLEERVVLRPQALASFESLLLADAASPAMLLFLDQASSRAPEVNENYGRELLELHTVGVDGGYGEDDVHHAALAFAGWTIDHQTFEFTFREEWHDPRPLKVMGWSHPGGSGPQRGRSLLRYLAQHPSTARRIAHKLAVRFVSEDPPTALVDRLATQYRSYGTAIVPVLELLFSADEFWAARGQRLRRPQAQYAAWLRGLSPRIDVRRGGESDAGRSIDEALRRLGQSPFGWPAPNGYPEPAGYWSGPGLVVERWSAPSRLVRNFVPGIEVDLHRMVEGLTTVTEAIDAFAARFSSRRPTKSERTVLETFAGGAQRSLADLDPDELAHLAHLVLVLPAAQWR